jgi:hypothetical protein
LSIDEEVRAIQQTLRQADYRIFDVQLGPAVRIEDLQALLLQHRPDILHFSGHGTETSALIFHNAQGNSVQVRGAPLGQLFQILKDNLRCVVLNACYTAELAEGLVGVIDCVVGIENAITDSAALQFTTAFYRALGYGRSVQEAFSLGQVQIEMAGLGDAAALHLAGENAGTLRFVGEPSATATKSTATTRPPVPVSPPVKQAAADADFLRSMLAQHQHNLQLLQRQKAMFGAGEEPLRLLNQIAAEEEEVAKLQQQLGT